MRRRFGADVLLAILLPVVAVLALLLLHPDRDEPHGEGPGRDPADHRVGGLPRRTARHRVRPARREHPRRGPGREGEGRRPGRARRVGGTAAGAHPPGLHRTAGTRPGGGHRLRRPRARPGRRALAVGAAGRGRLRATGGRPVVHRGRRGRDPQLGDRAGQPERRPGHRRHHGPLTQRRPRRAGAARRLGARQQQPRCSTSARSCRTAPSSRSRCTPAGAGSRCTSSTPTTSSDPVPAARTGCRRRPSRPPPTCCSG